ncbi:STAS domain-containing protein [Pseudonocardia sp. ICBG601]|uniref:STAS domain-containing protein n=1 Tax=Pseudonocardia sp. ICBG601 TaxID=2846759 RepID=UPI001CF63EAE|nr:STAS domain-containing protein [Pseudonocardia sp. ICBG601]
MSSLPFPRADDDRSPGPPLPRRPAARRGRDHPAPGWSGTGPPLRTDTLGVTAVLRPGPRVQLHLVGEVDRASSPALSRYLQHWVAVSDCVTLDLSCVDFIDASGLTALLIGLHHAGRTRTHLRLAHRPSHPAERTLAVSGVRTLFDDAGHRCPHRH